MDTRVLIDSIQHNTRIDYPTIARILGSSRGTIDWDL